MIAVFWSQLKKSICSCVSASLVVTLFLGAPFAAVGRVYAKDKVPSKESQLKKLRKKVHSNPATRTGKVLFSRKQVDHTALIRQMSVSTSHLNAVFGEQLALGPGKADREAMLAALKKVDDNWSEFLNLSQEQRTRDGVTTLFVGTAIGGFLWGAFMQPFIWRHSASALERQVLEEGATAQRRPYPWTHSIPLWTVSLALVLWWYFQLAPKSADARRVIRETAANFYFSFATTCRTYFFVTENMGEAPESFPAIASQCEAVDRGLLDSMLIGLSAEKMEEGTQALIDPELERLGKESPSDQASDQLSKEKKP